MDRQEGQTDQKIEKRTETRQIDRHMDRDMDQTDRQTQKGKSLLQLYNKESNMNLTNIIIDK